MRALSLFVVGVAFTFSAVAATYTVTNTNDSGAGSLRQAITDANANAGADVIAFDIAAAGVQTIAPATNLPTITDPVDIDGTTQTGASANTLALGSDAVLLIELSGQNGATTGLSFNSLATGSQVHGLVINRFQNGITFSGTDDSLIYGNFIGTDATGAIDRGNTSAGLFILSGAQNNIIGGATAAERNVISGNFVGISMGNSTTQNNLIVGNYIGPSAAGTAVVPGHTGISINGAGPNTIGYGGAGNVISGNTGSNGAGIAISNNTTGITVDSNLIGVRPDGTTAMGNTTGISFYDGFSGAPQSTVIASNVIANSTADGISTSSSLGIYPLGNYFTDNSIYGNGGLGIDLADNGVTANDVLDGDDGPNGLQNFPTLTSATALSGVLTVMGTLQSKVGAGYDLHFFHDTACDGSGNGEGRTHLGEISVTTNAAGDAAFQFSTASGITSGVITALAIEQTPAGNTSEFSACVSVTQPAQPAFSIGDVSVQEGAAGTQIVTFQVFLSGAAGAGASVNWTTADSSATDADNDYEPASGTINLSGSQVGATIDVTINGDGTTEPDETFFVNLSGATGATISDSQGVGTIVNDDNVPAITIADVAMNEGNAGTTNMTFTVVVTPAATYQVEVDYATAAGTAGSSDFTSSSGTVTVVATDTDQTFTVPIPGDTTHEPNETFTVSLFNATNATIEDGTAIGTITNDDSEPAISINDPSVTEGNSGTKNMTFTITLTNASSQTISVPFDVLDGTATVADNDYITNDGSFTVTPGNTTATMSISIKGDTIIEGDETVTVKIYDPSNASLTDDTGTGTIQNDDVVVTPSVTVADNSAAEASGTLTFTLTLSPAPVNAGTITYSTADDTATSASDYASDSNTVNFAAAQTSVEVDITLTNDSLAESSETFFLNLTGATNAVIGDSQATGTITDEDPGPDLAVVKTGPSSVALGVPFEYEITVTNGGGDATNVEVTDVLPAGLEFIGVSTDPAASCSGTTNIVCTFATLDGGSSATVTIQVRATGLGTITNTATALADQLDTDGANNSESAEVTAGAAAADVPTASEWGLLVLLLAVAALALRRL